MFYFTCNHGLTRNYGAREGTYGKMNKSGQRLTISLPRYTFIFSHAKRTRGNEIVSRCHQLFLFLFRMSPCGLRIQPRYMLWQLFFLWYPKSVGRTAMRKSSPYLVLAQWRIQSFAVRIQSSATESDSPRTQQFIKLSGATSSYSPNQCWTVDTFQRPCKWLDQLHRDDNSIPPVSWCKKSSRVVIRGDDAVHADDALKTVNSFLFPSHSRAVTKQLNELFDFYRASAQLATQSPVLATIEMSVRPSVRCPSPSHACIVSKCRNKIFTDRQPKDSGLGDKKFIQKF